MPSSSKCADQQEEQEQNQLDTSLTDDSEVESTEEKPKKKPKKLKEADFDEDGMISIEDFEEIEAQQLGAKLY